MNKIKAFFAKNIKNCLAAIKIYFKIHWSALVILIPVWSSSMTLLPKKLNRKKSSKYPKIAWLSGSFLQKIYGQFFTPELSDWLSRVSSLSLCKIYLIRRPSFENKTISWETNLVQRSKNSLIFNFFSKKFIKKVSHRKKYQISF